MIERRAHGAITVRVIDADNRDAQEEIYNDPNLLVLHEKAFVEKVGFASFNKIRFILEEVEEKKNVGLYKGPCLFKCKS